MEGRQEESRDARKRVDGDPTKDCQNSISTSRIGGVREAAPCELEDGLSRWLGRVLVGGDYEGFQLRWIDCTQILSLRTIDSSQHEWLVLVLERPEANCAVYVTYSEQVA